MASLIFHLCKKHSCLIEIDGKIEIGVVSIKINALTTMSEVCYSKIFKPQNIRYAQFIRKLLHLNYLNFSPFMNHWKSQFFFYWKSHWFFRSHGWKKIFGSWNFGKSNSWKFHRLKISSILSVKIRQSCSFSSHWLIFLVLYSIEHTHHSWM